VHYRPLIFQSALHFVGIGTSTSMKNMPTVAGLHRADPSTSLDESIADINVGIRYFY